MKLVPDMAPWPLWTYGKCGGPLEIQNVLMQLPGNFWKLQDELGESFKPETQNKKHTETIEIPIAVR